MTHHTNTAWLTEAHRRLAGANLRSGAARSRVLEVMAHHGHCLIDAQRVADLTRDRGGSGSPASVYRVLDELVGLGLVRRESGDDGVGRYEIVDGSGHHHAVDLDSGDIIPFRDAELERAVQAAADRLGMRLEGHSILLRGHLRPDGRPSADR